MVIKLKRKYIIYESTALSLEKIETLKSVHNGVMSFLKSYWCSHRPNEYMNE